MLDKNQQLKQLRELTWQAIDEDPTLESDLRALFFFFEGVMKEGPNSEVYVTGCSFSQRGLNTLLVVKARTEGIPQVAYVTEKFPTDCVRTFGRLWLADRLKWYPDKFAAI